MEKTRLDWDAFMNTGDKIPHSYSERCALLAQEKGETNYSFTVWAEPKNDLEREIVGWLREKYPNHITSSMQQVVDVIRDFYEREYKQEFK